MAKAIGNLAPDRVTERRGSVHVFALNPDGSLLNNAQLLSLAESLQAKSHVSVLAYTSNVDVVEIIVSVIASLVPGSNPQTIADAMYANISDYLTLGKLPLGESIILSELEYQARLAGPAYVQSVIVGEVDGSAESTNLTLPFAYSAARLNTLNVELVSGGTSSIYTYGQGDPD